MKKKSKIEMLAISTVNQKNQEPKTKIKHTHISPRSGNQRVRKTQAYKLNLNNKFYKNVKLKEKSSSFKCDLNKTYIYIYIYSKPIIGSCCLSSKELRANAGDYSSILDCEDPEKKNGNALQYSCSWKSHGHWSLGGLQSMGHKEQHIYSIDMDNKSRCRGL